MLPTSNIRGFFEILMPGVFFFLNIAFMVIFLISILNPQQMSPNEIIEQFITSPVVAITLVIAIGYPVGMAFRLLKTARIDTTSARYIAFLKPKERGKLYLSDHFFYGNWMRKKIREHLPAEAARFYDEYWYDKYTASDAPTFFNFCKILIAKEDIQSGTEIYAAEAILRFLAGSYYALQFSVVIMVLILAIALASHNTQVAVLTGALVVTYLLLLHIILSQFRFLRAKEVDTVFNASFANRKVFSQLFPTTTSRRLISKSQLPEFTKRKELILNCWGERWEDERLVQSLDLEKLVFQMKAASIQHPYLSSLYFAGMKVDHPFFLENSRFALGIAVLPEDSTKASLPKRHPYQTELIVVLNGSINIHYEIDGKQTDTVVEENDYFVIPPDTCHWISVAGDGQGTLLYIKTNPAQEPQSLPCPSTIP